MASGRGPSLTSHAPAGAYAEDTNSRVNLTAGFNTYGLQWIPGTSLTWYLNGKVIGSITIEEASIWSSS
jgi:beta-glucanase (GH16 family)